MSHEIRHLEFRKSQYTPKQILKKVSGFAYDPMESSSYHGNLTFHDGTVYKNRDAALEAIKRFDRGWYSDHAVLYKEGRCQYWLVKVEWHC